MFICFEIEEFMSDLEWKLVLTFAYTPVSGSVPDMEGIYATGGIILFEDVPLVEFRCLAFTSMAAYYSCKRFRCLLLCPL